MANNLFLNTETIVSICAIIVSVVSLYVAWKTQRDQSTHNELSVRPLADFLIGDYEDSIFVKIKNHGTGPLIITNFKAFTETMEFERIMDALGNIKKDILWDRFTGVLRNRIIGSDKELILLQASFSETEYKQREILRSELCKLTLLLEYHDIYKKNQPSLEKSLDWFSR